MVNLLEFDRTGASDGESGQEAYGRYGDAVLKMIEAQGGTVLWFGSPRHVFIGDVDADDWDAVGLIMYPSRQAFIEMVSSPEYGDAHTHREGGLADTVVIACAPRRASRPSPPEADPHQWHNLWDDPAHKSRRDDLVADLYDSLPEEFNRRDVESVA